MNPPSLRAERPDGALICRVDGTGQRVAVLPATCKRGRHTLDLAHCRATVYQGEIHIGCPTCAADPGVDHHWRLTTTGPSPERAELDDQPYRDLRHQLMRTAARAADPA